jgi:hypothetical protein
MALHEDWEGRDYKSDVCLKQAKEALAALAWVKSRKESSSLKGEGLWTERHTISGYSL